MSTVATEWRRPWPTGRKLKQALASMSTFIPLAFEMLCASVQSTPRACLLLGSISVLPMRVCGNPML